MKGEEKSWKDIGKKEGRERERKRERKKKKRENRIERGRILEVGEAGSRQARQGGRTRQVACLSTMSL